MTTEVEHIAEHLAAYLAGELRSHVGEGPQECVSQICAQYQSRRDVMIKGLHEAGWMADKPKATMYIWAKIPPIAGPTITLTPHIADTSADALVHNQFGRAALITA